MDNLIAQVSEYRTNYNLPLAYIAKETNIESYALDKYLRGVADLPVDKKYTLTKWMEKRFNGIPLDFSKPGIKELLAKKLTAYKYENGYSLREVGEKIGYTYSTVARAMKNDSSISHEVWGKVYQLVNLNTQESPTINTEQPNKAEQVEPKEEGAKIKVTTTGGFQPIHCKLEFTISTLDELHAWYTEFDEGALHDFETNYSCLLADIISELRGILPKQHLTTELYW